MDSLKTPHSLNAAIWLSYLAFVVYGSLVPLDFTRIPLDQMLFIIQSTPMLKFDADSRADWIANIILSIPTGFLTTHLLIDRYSRAPRAILLIASCLFSVIFASTIEFAQIFFPPRISSLNDIYAQTIGASIGLLLATRYSSWFKNLLYSGYHNPRQRTQRLLEAYLVGYVAISLFPYDFLLSGAEFEQKLHGNNWGWWLSDSSQGIILAALKALYEIILALPFGLFLGRCSGSNPANYKQAILLGVLLGSFIETAQFFTVSGISEGLSILTRTAGICVGLALWRRRKDWPAEKLATLTRRYTLVLGSVYLLVLLQVNGWFSHQWIGSDFALSQLGKLHFMPFYYHYYTPEAKALLSLLIVCLMYTPIGLLTWLNQGSPTQALLFTLFAACVVETGKLFLQGMHPDPTNIILGAIASYCMVHLARTIAGAASMPPMSETIKSQSQETRRDPQSWSSSVPKKRPPPARHSISRWKHHATYTVLVFLLAFAAYWAATFPTQPLVLCLFLTGCAAMIWHRPVLLIAILPAALPVLDFAQWSGRFYLDEFDLLLLVGLVVGYVRTGSTSSDNRPTDTFLFLVSALVAASFTISAMRGLLPWQAPDANSFNNYYSPFNALRIGKGALWAYLTYAFLRRLTASGKNIQRPFTLGMVAGLTLTVAVVFWERLTFSGLVNFSSDYRVTGPFSSMHIGGAYIECFLATSTPFLLLFMLQTRSWIIRMLGAILLLATTYALMVTFSRNGYSAYGIALSIILFFAIFKSGHWQRRSIIAALLTGAMLTVAVPVFTGKFAQNRMATVRADLVVRQAHWKDSLDIRSSDWFTTLFGMGLGRFPETNYLLSRESNRSGTYKLIVEEDNTFLRLVSGSSIYIGQRVSVKPKHDYLLKLDARSNESDATITVPICEKWLISSFVCMWSTMTIGKETGVWRHLEAKLSSDQLNISHWYSQRPIKLSLYNGNSNAIVDIDNVRLETIEGGNLIRNGDFSNEIDHWFFTADSHLQWHTKSLPVAVLFDQGWFGLVTLGLFSLLAIKRATSRAWRGDLYAAAFLASFCGFLVVCVFDTLIDAPRFLFVFLLLGWFCCFGTQVISTED